MLKIQEKILKWDKEKSQTRKVNIFNEYFEFNFTISYYKAFNNRLIIKGEKNKKMLGEEGKTKVNIDMTCLDWKNFETPNKKLILKTYYLDEKNQKKLYGPNGFLDYAIKEIKKIEEQIND